MRRLAPALILALAMPAAAGTVGGTAAAGTTATAGGTTAPAATAAMGTTATTPTGTTTPANATARTSTRPARRRMTALRGHSSFGGIPPLLKKVETSYAKATTLTAEFQETDQSAATGLARQSSGTIEFKRPGMVRWETLKPDQNLLVGDGRHFWFYTPPFDSSEHGQYIEKRSSQVQSRMAQALLSASFSGSDVARSMMIRQSSPTEFTLKPRKGAAGSVTLARIRIDPAKKLITSVNLEHDGGNKSRIELSHIQLGKPLTDDRFRFTPPPNTDQIIE